MKRYRIKKREIWEITYEVDATDEDAAQDTYEPSDEVKREYFNLDSCEEFNTIKEIQK